MVELGRWLLLLCTFTCLRTIKNKASDDLSHFVTRHISAVAMVKIGQVYFLQYCNVLIGNL